MNNSMAEFLRILRQYLMIDDEIEMEVSLNKGKIELGERSFEYKFYVSFGAPLLQIEFSGCAPNYYFVVQDLDGEWRYFSDDPIIDMTSEELADFFLNILHADEQI